MMKPFPFVLAIIWVIQALPQDRVEFPTEEEEVVISKRIPGFCTAINGQQCVFPFIFKGETYNECTFAGDSKTAWCALERNNNLEVVINRWGDCEIGQNNCPVESGGNIVTKDHDNNFNTNKDCYTTGGPDRNKRCIFPFIHGALKYHDCTTAGHTDRKLWCSTKVDNDGRHIAGQGFFGTCSGLCFGNSNANSNSWNNWSSWGSCSAYCGGGSGAQERTRRCQGSNCAGNKTETKSCQNVVKCANGASCQIGSTWKQDCNTCICTSEGKTVCTTIQCSGNSGAERCVTTSGPSGGQPCVFPFAWGGRTFTSCNVWGWGGRDQGKFWCSTKTNINRSHINGQGNYGFCPDSSICRGLDLGIHNRILVSNNTTEPEHQLEDDAPQ